MKKIITICAAILMTASLRAQSPEKMSYQAVVRDVGNNLVASSSVGMQISILLGSPSGTAVYVETQTPTSNANGLVSLEIGAGTVVSGDFTTIDWANGPYFIKTESDPTGGTNYTITGTSQLLSVPYALYAKTSGSSTPGPQGPAGADGIGIASTTDNGDGTFTFTYDDGTTFTTSDLTGPQGNTGATGPQGAAGLLTNGTTAGNTPYWNGTQWVVNNSNIHNNGAGVGIGTATPNASAKVEIVSTTQGFLPPRMTSAQRDVIASPAIGLVIYNTTTNCLNFYIGTGWNETCGNPALPLGTISALNCGSATNNGTLTEGQPASGVSSEIPYTGGNGGTHSGQTVTSTGVTGLTATLSSGTFASGAGSLNYTITGTPSASGTASFALNIGGQTCTLTTSVAAAAPTYPTGSVFCAGATTVVDVTNPSTGKIWMDRNLGASQVATSSTDVNSYGDLYQWGRRSDGHQCRNSATTSTLSSTDQPAHGSFILAPNSPNDWRSPQNSNLWQGVNGVNNPCPSGYRLPTNAELDSERSSWSQNNRAGAFASPLKLPVAGHRLSGLGSLVSVGSSGYYWSSTVNGTLAFFLNFNSSNANMYFNSRAFGLSVRCLKD